MRAFIAYIGITASSLVAAQSPGAFPASNSTYLDGPVFRSTYERRLVALEGKIIRTALGPKDKPMYEMFLAYPASRSVWVGNTMFDKERRFIDGSTIRVLGYLNSVQSDDSWTRAVTTDKQHVIGFCFLNLETKIATYLPPAFGYCKDWQEGKTPEEMTK